MACLPSVWMWLTRDENKVWKWTGESEDTVKAWNAENPNKDKGGCAFIKSNKDKVEKWNNTDCDAPGLALCERRLSCELSGRTDRLID